MFAHALRTVKVMLALAVCLSARAEVPGDGSIFVNLLIQKRELYVGESVPVVIQVGAQDDVVASLDSPPSLRGDAFTLNVLSGEPEREQRVIDGKPCTLLAWHSLLAAVKPGTLSLTIEAPLTVRVPVTQRPEATFVDDATGDPYADPQTLLQSTTAQTIVASSPALEFHVLALPVEHRPAGFSGAVGSFEISSELSKGRSVVGEPLTLRMHVRGTGNFDRVNSGMLDQAEHWKLYRPTATFAAAEKTGFRGEKLFEQAIVATKPGARSLPALEFSYFDPETRRYTIAKAPPLSIEVAPGPAAPTSAATGGETTGGGTSLRADHVDTVGGSSLLPLYLQAPFLSVPVLLIAAFSGVWFKRLHRDQGAADGLPGGADDATTASSMPELLRDMESAAAAGDVRTFFRSASFALRRAGVMQDDTDVREILRRADEANYAGTTPEAADLPHYRELVLRCLASAAISPAAVPAGMPTGFPVSARYRPRDR